MRETSLTPVNHQYNAGFVAGQRYAEKWILDIESVAVPRDLLEKGVYLLYSKDWWSSDEWATISSIHNVLEGIKLPVRNPKND